MRRCYESWFFGFGGTELHELDDYRSIEELPSSCDLLIVGGGYAGISATYHLLYGDELVKSPNPSTVLAETRRGKW
jgi:hypothetical protein